MFEAIKNEGIYLDGKIEGLFAVRRGNKIAPEKYEDEKQQSHFVRGFTDGFNENAKERITPTRKDIEGRHAESLYLQGKVDGNIAAALGAISKVPNKKKKYCEQKHYARGFVDGYAEIKAIQNHKKTDSKKG